MPYYLITIKLQNGKKVQGIKVHNNANIDAMYNFFYNQASSHYRNELKDFECVIIAKQSKAYRKWMEGKNKKNWFDDKLDDIPNNPRPGTQSKKKEGPILPLPLLGERKKD